MVSTQSVVVTGASTGIGRACALYLDRKGWRVFAGVRRTEDGERLREKAQRLTPVLLDVTDQGSIESAAQVVREEAGPGGLQGLVNNAGVAVGGPLEFLPLEQMRDQFEVNVFGQMAVTQALLPDIRAARGRIVNMSSISGRTAPPFLGPYAGSKFALEALSDALRVELQPWGIDVIVVEPGAIKTPIWEKGIERATHIRDGLPEEAEAFYGEALDQLVAAARKSDENGVSPLVVAKAVYRALTDNRPRTRYIVGSDARTSALAARVLPDRLMDRLKARRMGVPGAGSGT